MKRIIILLLVVGSTICGYGEDTDAELTALYGYKSGNGRLSFVFRPLSHKWWSNKKEAEEKCFKFQKCKTCRGLGYCAKITKKGTPQYSQRRTFYYDQCPMCITNIVTARGVFRARHREQENKKEYIQCEKICSSLIGAIDEIAPKPFGQTGWVFGYKGREKNKDYGWTPDDAKLMPARCPIVFQVINSKSFLVKSQVEGTVVFIDTSHDYEVCDGKPFLCWGTYRYVGTKSYTTVLGAKKTVPWMKQIDEKTGNSLGQKKF